jgi:hypothetical protein
LLLPSTKLFKYLPFHGDIKTDNRLLCNIKHKTEACEEIFTPASLKSLRAQRMRFLEAIRRVPLVLNNFVNFVHSVEDSPYWHLSGQQGAGTTWRERLACGEPRPEERTPDERAGEAGG